MSGECTICNEHPVDCQCRDKCSWGDPLLVDKEIVDKFHEIVVSCEEGLEMYLIRPGHYGIRRIPKN